MFHEHTKGACKHAYFTCSKTSTTWSWLKWSGRLVTYSLEFLMSLDEGRATLTWAHTESGRENGREFVGGEQTVFERRWFVSLQHHRNFGEQK